MTELLDCMFVYLQVPLRNGDEVGRHITPVRACGVPIAGSVIWTNYFSMECLSSQNDFVNKSLKLGIRNREMVIH